MVINLIPTWNSGQTIVDLLVDSLVVVEFKKIINYCRSKMRLNMYGLVD